MHILVTRPKDDAAELAKELAGRGIETTIEPLLRINAAANPAIGLDKIQAILFTSANGVRCFAAANSRRDIKVFTVGDNSAAVARDAGFTDVTSASGDVRSLADLVTARLHPRQGALLHAGGSSLAGDLRGQLQASGFVVERVVLYDAEPVTELSPATVMNLRLGGIDAVALFSPRTARTFAELWRRAQAGDSAEGLAGVTALCLSAAVAAEIRGLGWRDIAIATTPDRNGMLALIAREEGEGEPMSEDRKMAPAGDAPRDMPGDRSGDRTAAADPARGAAIIAAAPTARKSGAGAALLGLVAGAVAGGCVALAAPYWGPLIGVDQAAPADNGALAEEIAAIREQLASLGNEQDVDTEARSRIEALQSEIANWKSELDMASGQSSGSAMAALDLAPLEGRLEALEGRVASLGGKITASDENAGQGPAGETQADADANANANADADAALPSPSDDSGLEDLTRRFAELETKLGSLDALQRDTETQKAEIEAANARLAIIDSLNTRLDALESTADTLGSDLQKVAADQGEAMARQQRSAALVLSIGQLRASLSADKPFAAELAALEDLARPDADVTARLDPMLAALRDQAARGAPTLAQLQASFPATQIAQAATADAAGDAIGAEQDWLRKTLNRLAELVTVRPVGDVAGEGALAILARGENRLAAGDLAGAVAELDGLSGQPADAVAPWLRNAEARLASDAAASQLAAFSAEALVAAPADTAPDQSN